MLGSGLLQPWHLLVILVIVLIVFGPGKLPDLGQSLGRGIREFKSSIKGDDDEPVDSKLMFTNWLRDHMNGTLADVAAYGLPTLAGANLSRRIGMSDMYGMANDPPPGKHGKELAAWWAASQLGPAFSVGQSMFQGYDEMVNKGNYMKGLEAATPKPIKDALKAYRVATEGVKNSQGKKILADEEIGVDEVVLLALGFNADEVAKAQAAEGSLRGISVQVSERRGRLINDAAKAVLSGDTADALEAIRKFNSKMPRFAINGGDIRPAIQKRMKGDYGTTGVRDRGVAAQFEVPVYGL